MDKLGTCNIDLSMNRVGITHLQFFPSLTLTEHSKKSPNCLIPIEIHRIFFSRRKEPWSLEGAEQTKNMHSDSAKGETYRLKDKQEATEIILVPRGLSLPISNWCESCDLWICFSKIFPADSIKAESHTFNVWRPVGVDLKDCLNPVKYLEIPSYISWITPLFIILLKFRNHMWVTISFAIYYKRAKLDLHVRTCSPNHKILCILDFEE